MDTPQERINAKRIVLGIEYDGSSYHGWQRQSHAASVQSTLERCLSEVADHNVEVVCAGRTDTGVHATAQVVHFDCLTERPTKAWLNGVNSLLPDSISIRFASEISLDFHARFSATSRSYLYIIDNSPIKPAIMSDGLTWIKQVLDVEKMGQACEHFLGEQDFSSFRSSQCQSHTANRCITELSCQRLEHYIAIKISANAFLHHMVRNIVGVLLDIGHLRKSSSWARDVINAKNRCAAGVTAPANGLYLVAVEYPEQFNLAKNIKLPFFLNHRLK